MSDIMEEIRLYDDGFLYIIEELDEGVNISYKEMGVESETFEIFIANGLVDIFIDRLTHLQKWRKDKGVDND